MVPVEEIRATGYDLNISKYKKKEKPETTYRPSTVILDELKNEEKSFVKCINELRITLGLEKMDPKDFFEE